MSVKISQQDAADTVRYLEAYGTTGAYQLADRIKVAVERESRRIARQKPRPGPFGRVVRRGKKLKR